MNESTTPRYQAIATALQARANCERPNFLSQHWFKVWSEVINLHCEGLPSGSGFDNGTELDLERSNDQRMIFTTSFHHMNDVGMYDGWSDHTITVSGNLASGFTLSISGRNRKGIKDYIGEVFSAFLSERVNTQTVISQATATVADRFAPVSPSA